MQNKSKIMEFYERFSYLSREYAFKVRNYDRYGLEFDDIVQEMNIKLYFAIVGYGRAWREYRNTGNRKPAPIESWIRLTLSNKVKDYIKKFNTPSISNQEKISVGSGEDTVDVGHYTTMESNIDFDNNTAIINSIDVLKGLRGERLECYKKFLIGYSVKELSTMFPRINTLTLINQHNNYLKKHSRELQDFYSVTFESHVHSEE